MEYPPRQSGLCGLNSALVEEGSDLELAMDCVKETGRNTSRPESEHGALSALQPHRQLRRRVLAPHRLNHARPGKCQVSLVLRPASRRCQPDCQEVLLAHRPRFHQSQLQLGPELLLVHPRQSLSQDSAHPGKPRSQPQKIRQTAPLVQGVVPQTVPLLLLVDVVKRPFQVVLIPHRDQMGRRKPRVQWDVVVQADFHSPGKLPSSLSPATDKRVEVCVGH